MFQLSYRTSKIDLPGLAPQSPKSLSCRQWTSVLSRSHSLSLRTFGLASRRVVLLYLCSTVKSTQHHPSLSSRAASSLRSFISFVDCLFKFPKLRTFKLGSASQSLSCIEFSTVESPQCHSNPAFKLAQFPIHPNASVSFASLLKFSLVDTQTRHDVGIHRCLASHHSGLVAASYLAHD
jgi:hypothetical protein